MQLKPYEINTRSGLLCQTPEPIFNPQKMYRNMDNESVFRATNRMSKQLYAMSLKDQVTR